MLVGKVKKLDSVMDEDGNLIKHNGTIKSNYIDNYIYEAALDDAVKVRDAITERQEESPFFNKMSQDMFNGLYKPSPVINHKDNVQDSLKMEHDLVSDMIDNEKINKLRGNTVGDMFNSTLSLNMFQDQAYNKIQEWTQQSKENEEAMKKMNEAIEKQDDLDRMNEELEYDPENQQLKDDIAQAKQDIESLNKEITDSQGAGESGGTKGVQGLKKELSEIMNNLEKEVQDANDALDAFGMGGGPGGSGDGEEAGKTTPFEDKKALIEALQNSAKLKAVTEQLGRIKEAIHHTGKKSSKYGQVVCDIGVGNNIKRALSTEKVKLIDSDLEVDFFKRYIDKNLLEYKTQGTQDTKGPIIVCIDNSGSMSGRRDVWAKAVAIAMLQLAIKDKRDYRALFFCQNVVGKLDFHKEKPELKHIRALAEFWKGGGTDFEPVLEEALSSIEESRFKKADIVFITDGDPRHELKQPFLEKLRRVKYEKDFKIQTILIGNTMRRYVEPFSDDIIELQDLNKNNDLVSIFNKVQEQE